VVLSELVARVRGNIARGDKDDLIRGWLNEGLLELARLHDWRVLDTRATIYTEPGVELSELPGDLRVLQAVRVDSWLVPEVHPLEMDRMRPSTRTVLKGRPRYYALQGNKGSSRQHIRWLPVPDAAYPVELQYSRWPKPMAADDDEPELPNVDDALIAYATAEGFMHLQLYEDAAAWRSEWMRRVGVGARLDRRRDGWTPGWIKVPHNMPTGDAAFDPFVRRVR